MNESSRLCLTSSILFSVLYFFFPESEFWKFLGMGRVAEEKELTMDFFRFFFHNPSESGRGFERFPRKKAAIFNFMNCGRVEDCCPLLGQLG